MSLNHKYLESPDTSVLRLDDDGQTWIWCNNETTAAFNIQLAGILEPLALHLGGLPPLTAILCVVSALRKWEGTDVWVERLRVLPTNGIRADGFLQVVRWLEMIAAFPESLRTGPEATVGIVGCGLSNKRSWLMEATANDAKEVVRILQLEIEDQEAIGQKTFDPEATNIIRRSATRCRRAWDALLELSKAVVSADMVQDWTKTGLKEMPNPDKDPFDEGTDAHTIASTLSELENDNAFAPLVDLSKSLAGMISLPRRPTDPDEMPMGGVSDVSNRGNPERLLMTELAADPMMLLARIANGQALYLRREIPPGPTPDVRPLLVESSIRCWGITRVKLASLAIAIGMSEERRGKVETQCYSVDATSMIPIDLKSREGLVGFIGRLQPSAEPSGGIRCYFESIQDADERAQLAEPIMLLTEATVSAPEFQQRMSSIPRPYLMGIVDRSGATRLVRRTAMGDEHLQQFQLDLKQQSEQLGVSEVPQVPLFVQQPIAPLSFSPSSRDAHWDVGMDLSGAFAVWLVTGDRRLLRFTRSDRGGDQITDAVPASSVVASSAAFSRFECVTGSPGKPHHLLVAEADDHQVKMFELKQASGGSYVFSGEFLLCFQITECIAYSRHDGSLVAKYDTRRTHFGLNYQMERERTVWVHGGAMAHDWHRLGTVSQALPTPIGAIVPGPDHQPVAVGADLKWAAPLDWLNVLKQPNVVELKGDSPEFTSSRPVIIAGDNKSQTWVIEVRTSTNLVFDADTRQDCSRFKIDLLQGTVTKIPIDSSSDCVRAIYPKAYPIVQQKPIRRRIVAVGLGAGGLMFSRSGGSWFQVQVAETPPTRLVLRSTSVNHPTFIREFEKPYTLRNKYGDCRWTLRKAETPNGVCWLDSRGFVHLKRNNDHRSLTLVLVDTHVAGWFSASGVFGPSYFQPQSSPTNTTTTDVPSDVVDWLRGWSL